MEDPSIVPSFSVYTPARVWPNALAWLTNGEQADAKFLYHHFSGLVQSGDMWRN